MAKLLLIVKILPTGTEINLDELVNSVRNNLKDDIELKEYSKEPLAFGLEFVKAQFILDDAEGQMDSLENSVKSTIMSLLMRVFYCGFLGLRATQEKIWPNFMSMAAVQ